MRGQFEPYALRLAIERGDSAWEESVVGIFHRLTRIEKSAEKSPELWEAAHREFHMCLIGGCGMPLLVRFCGSLHDLSDRYRRLYMDPPPRGNVAKEHAAIIDAVLARDAETACRILAEHSQRSGNAVYKRLQALKASAVEA